MNTRRKRRQVVLGLILGLVAASVLAGPAQARPDDLDGTLAHIPDTQVSVRPDDRATRISPTVEQLVDGWALKYSAEASSTATNVPDSRADRGHFGGGQQVIAVSDETGSRIDYRDAAFGALGATGLLALMAAMVLVVRHTKHGRLATS